MFETIGQDFRQAVIDTDPAIIDTDLNLVSSDEKQLQQNFATYLAFPHVPAEAKLVATFQQAEQQWLDTLHQMLDVARQNTPEAEAQAITQMHEQWLPQAKAASAALNALIDDSTQDNVDSSVEASDTLSRVVIMMVISVIVAIIIAMVLGRVMTNMIVLPIRAMVSVVKQMANGELSEMPHLVERHGGKDATGELVLVLEDTMTRLRSLISQVTKMSSKMAATTDEIAEGAHQTGNASDQGGSSHSTSGNWRTGTKHPIKHRNGRYCSTH